MKYFLMIIVFCVMSSVCIACVDGHTHFAKNSDQYCISNKRMNWWSAFQWCKAQGYRLATLDDCYAEGNVAGTNPVGTGCPNLTGTAWIAHYTGIGWLANGDSTGEKSYIVYINGTNATQLGNRNSDAYVVCRMN